jgi:hypothetical protein
MFATVVRPSQAVIIGRALKELSERRSLVARHVNRDRDSVPFSHVTLLGVAWLRAPVEELLQRAYSQLRVTSNPQKLQLAQRFRHLLGRNDLDRLRNTRGAQGVGHGLMG